MDITAIKFELHKLIDKIDDERLLLSVYALLQQNATMPEGSIWKTLNDEQKKLVYMSFIESEFSENLIDWDKIRSQ